MLTELYTHILKTNPLRLRFPRSLLKIIPPLLLGRWMLPKYAWGKPGKVAFWISAAVIIWAPSAALHRRASERARSRKFHRLFHCFSEKGKEEHEAELSAFYRFSSLRLKAFSPQVSSLMSAFWIQLLFSFKHAKLVRVVKLWLGAKNSPIKLDTEVNVCHRSVRVWGFRVVNTADVPLSRTYRISFL